MKKIISYPVNNTITQLFLTCQQSVYTQSPSPSDPGIVVSKYAIGTLNGFTVVDDINEPLGNGFIDPFLEAFIID